MVKIEEGKGLTVLHGDIDARSWIKRFYVISKSPFLPESFVRSFLIAAILFAISVLEKILKQPLYIRNVLGGLGSLNPSSLVLLQRLTKEKIISSWWLKESLVDGPRIFVCGLVMDTVNLPNDKKYHPRSTSAGAALSADDALIPALAECIERHALSVWDDTKIYTAPYKEVKKNFVSPQKFLSYDTVQLEDEYFKNSRIDPVRALSWTHAHGLVSGVSHFIPTQTVYLTFSLAYPDELVLGGTSSNGAAAARTYQDACVRALCEAVERDAFFIHWFNNITPPRIDISTIPQEVLRIPIEEFTMWRYRVELVDITTDLSVPTVCGVLIDDDTNTLIAVATATDFNVSRAINKIFFDLARWVRVPRKHILKPFTEPDEMIKTFNDRERYWSEAGSVRKLAWLLEGSLKSFSDIQALYGDQEKIVAIKDRYTYFKSLFSEKGYESYFVDVTSPLAKESGLVIVKAVTPDLVPVYFDEKKKPLNIQRIFGAPCVMGSRTQPLRRGELNLLPHPFI